MEGGDSIVLEEEIDPNYEPTEKEVLEYATWLGMDLEAERDLFWIAREGLKAPLPENWKPCKTTDTEEIYYFNFANGQSTWDHPCDEFYRNLYEEHKKKLHSKDGQTDEKKKKIEEDVAELLGRKNAGKKKKGFLTKTQSLSGSTLENVFEKKSLPGLTSRLGSVGGGPLKSVAGLGPLKREAKDSSGLSITLDNGKDNTKANYPNNLLTKVPLGTSLSKKPQLTSSSTIAITVGKTEPNDDAAFEVESKELQQNQVKMLREVQDTHARDLEALRKKLKAQLEDVQDAEEMKLKQLKRDLEKKKTLMKNQFDQEETALKRNRNDQLNRLEIETENTFRHKKEELDRNSRAEIDKISLRHEATQRKIQEEFDQEANELKNKTSADYGELKEAAQFVIELRAEIEQLHDQQKTLELKLSTACCEKQTLIRDKKTAENERKSAYCEVKNLQKQLFEINSRADLFSESCSRCLALETQSAQSNEKCIEAQSQVKELQKELLTLQQECDDVKKANVELVQNYRDRENASKLETAALLDKVSSLEAELSNHRLKPFQSKTEMMGQERDKFTLERQADQLEVLQKQLATAQAEATSAKIELQNVQSQHAVTSMNNLQLKELLTQEADERKNLCKQLKLENEQYVEYSNYQQLSQALEQKLDDENRARQELEDTCDALRRKVKALEQINRCLDAKNSQLESDKPYDDLPSDCERVVGLCELENEVGPRRQEQSSLEKALRSRCAENKLLVHDQDATSANSRLDRHGMEKFTKNFVEINERETDECAQCSIYKARILSIKSVENEYHTELENMRKVFAELKNSAAEERESSMARTADLQREINNAAAALQDQKNCAEREVAGLKQKISTLEAERAKVRDGCDSFQSEENVASKSESYVTSSGLKAQEQLLILERQLVESSAEIASAKAELHDLQISHQTLMMKNEQTEEKCAKELNENEKLLRQLNFKTEEFARRLAGATDNHQKQLLRYEQQVDKESFARREQENVCDTLRKELLTAGQAKGILDAQVDQLKSDNRRLESEMAMFTLRIDDMNVTRKQDEKLVMSSDESLAEKKVEVRQLQASLNLVELDKEHFETRVRNLAHDLEQVQTEVRRLETENKKERVRSRSLEIERDTALQLHQKLVDELENCQRNYRGLSTDMSDLQNQINKAKPSEQIAAKKEEPCAQKLSQLEQQMVRDQIALQTKLHQAEVEHESGLLAKEKAEMQIKAKEEELATANLQITRKESDLQMLQARFNSLLSNKEKVQAVLSDANKISLAMASANRDSANLSSASTDTMLVKLQLAEANRKELNDYLSDISSQLETSTRLHSMLDARCRDQAVEIESLHTEIASLRSIIQEMHFSALESLTNVERLEYERKKRTLRIDFMIQFREFQQREEQALGRHKARIRAQYERQVDDMIADLEKTRQQRLEQEEALFVQMLQQIRNETDIKRIEAKKQMRAELLQLEEELHGRKAREIKMISKAIEREEDALDTSLRDIRQVKREKTLAEQHESLLDYNLKGKGLQKFVRPASSGQLTNRHNKTKKEPEIFERDDGDTISSRRGQLTKRQDRRHKNRAKTYQRWKRRLQKEIDILVNARNLVANQRHGLAKHAQQLKASEREWKQNSRLFEANSIHRDLKRMFDEDMTNWSESMRKLREQDAWVKQRELIVAKMKRTVNRLRQIHTKQDNNLLGTSSDDDENKMCGEWSDYSNSIEQLASTLDKLERLEEELNSDAGTFLWEARKKVDDDLYTAYQAPPSFIVQHGDTFRYPSLDSYAPKRAIKYSTGPEMRWIRSQRGFGQRGSCFELEPPNRSATHAEHIYHQKIFRWAKGREKVQHAATNHATWLSGLCEELKEYGAKYTKNVGEPKEMSDNLHFSQEH